MFKITKIKFIDWYIIILTKFSGLLPSAKEKNNNVANSFNKFIALKIKNNLPNP